MGIWVVILPCPSGLDLFPGREPLPEESRAIRGQGGAGPVTLPLLPNECLEPATLVTVQLQAAPPGQGPD